MSLDQIRFQAHRLGEFGRRAGGVPVLAKLQTKTEMGLGEGLGCKRMASA